MQPTTQDNYNAMVQILAEMVTSYFSTHKRSAKASVDERTIQYICAQLEREDDEFADFELTAQLLGTRDFRQIA
ncbi:hypothetical protein ACTID9_28315 [Brevibacillus fluminis]|uniref:hypothetical protein n=1 Tax=Brevibacillus fluminis TaxID=511487 RepID=UPI003F8B203B